MQGRRPLIYLIAGEPSGDLLGANLLSFLKSQGYDFAGIGGDQMKAQGLQSLFPMEELSIVGVCGILKRLPQLLSRISQTVKDIQVKKPDVVLTIDSPEFSFRVQKKLRGMKAAECPFQAHLVAPTVWAWRPGRAERISKLLDHLFCLYPFEPPLFEKYGLTSTFVGHPIVNEKLGDGPKFRQVHGIDQSGQVLCVLPGSRSSEIKTLLPIFRTAVHELQMGNPNLRTVMPTVDKHYEFLEQEVSKWAYPPVLIRGEGERQGAFAASNAALAASGTVSMQLAHAGVPMVVAYKIGLFPQSWMKVIIQTPWVCMINILLGRRAIPELLQTDCTAHQCVQALHPLLQGASSQRDDLEEAMDRLTPPDGGTSEIIFNTLQKV